MKSAIEKMKSSIEKNKIRLNFLKRTRIHPRLNFESRPKSSIEFIVNAARCPPQPSQARSVCGSTASSRAGQVAIQEWTGSGVVGPIDVMSRTRLLAGAPAPGAWAGWAGPCLGGLLVGLGLKLVSAKSASGLLAGLGLRLV